MDLAGLVEEKVINLNRRNLHDGDLDVLAEVLQSSDILEELHLWNNQITLANDYGKLFTTALAHNHTLRELSLLNNEIGDAGAETLAVALKANQTLQKVHLGGNKIGDEGCKRLAGALRTNCSLHDLRLDSNGIGDEGAKSLASALVYNEEGLRTLGLCDNNIGDEGAQILAASFLVNRSLQKMWLAGNNISDEGARTLANALKCNHVIKDLYLRHDNFSNDVMAEIKDILHDPKRKDAGSEKLPLRQLIALLLTEKDDEIGRLNDQIASMENNNTVDLTREDHEPSNKRPRAESAPKSSLAVLHDQIQKTTQIKQEKDTAMANLTTVMEEKETVEAELENMRDDLGDANDLVQQQTLANDIWWRRFDELASLAAAGQVDGAVIAEIRNRSLASGS